MNTNTTKEYYVIPVQNGVAFPFMEILLNVNNQALSGLIQDLNHKKEFLTLAYEDELGNLYHTGILAKINQVLGNRIELNIIAEGVKKIKILRFFNEGEFTKAAVKEIEEEILTDDEETALMKHIKAEIRKTVKFGKIIDFLLLSDILVETNPIKFSYQISSIVDAGAKGKQHLLEASSTKERLEMAHSFLNHELKILEIERDIDSKTQEKFTKDAKDAILRERLREIKKELGEDAGINKDLSDLKKKIEGKNLPEQVRERASSELERLSKMGPFNPESSYIRTYLDWLVDLPWSTVDKTEIDIADAKKVLDEDHYGLEKVKERILEYLSVLKLKQIKNNEIKNIKAENILCFVGPPGVGKTSIGKSIAKVLGRKFASMSLGGIRDEAEIRGHRRTYVGALPGRIIQHIKNAGSRNPVFILDEIDKVTDSFMGNPSAALLEVLDPAQNKTFSDNYLEIPFDLSEVFFITTANGLDTIPPALRDRLEIIYFPGYTEDEKLQISKKFLIKKQLDSNGLSAENLSFSNESMLEIIRSYTKEAGVRSLERTIATICRKIARKILEDNISSHQIIIRPQSLQEFLGPKVFRSYIAGSKNEVGVATGLAWTQAGGEIVFIEVATMPGTGQLTLTGQLGEVMQESCKAALSYVRSHAKELDIDEDFYKNLDIHIHVPEGAAPKDGPSAGTAIITALSSALSKHPVQKDVGMTGEITLRGNILEISGVKEKLIAAQRAGLKKVFLPESNKKDIEDIPEKIRKELNLNFANNVKDILDEAIIRK